MDIIAIEKEVFEMVVDRINQLDTRFNKNETELINDHLFTSKDVQQILGVGSTTLQNYRDTGKISFIKIGNTIRYRWEDLKKLIQSHKQ